MFVVTMQQPPQNAAGAGQQIPSDQQAYHQQKLSWMMQQQQGQQWNQQSAPSQGQQPYGSQNPGSDNEIRSLWIGALQPWMDESYIMTVFAQAGEACIRTPKEEEILEKAIQPDAYNFQIFVGALDASVTDEELRAVFGQFGELTHVKIPPGKRCGFVQYATRASAEHALLNLNGTQLGGQSIRLSWGRSPNNQAQPHQAQWNGGGGYYGYPPQPQGFEPYGHGAPRPQDPSAYYGGGYGGYGNYQQQRQTYKRPSRYSMTKGYMSRLTHNDAQKEDTVR
ncbi:hypothetical protein HID58_038321 [Brassica napus]|uniref:RRM domain-containing protein n=1 Tax=Brassica napus TaxID=3708 RepID=A0ABQ8BNZ5_BRANA|nr:hypothetical protein HID58_038321 [Brassica napus]